MKRLSILLLAVLMLSSCDKLLNIEPVNDIPADEAIKSMQDLENLSNSMYSGLQGNSLYGGNFQLYADLLAEDTQVDESRLTPFGTQEIYQRATTIQIGTLRDTWREAYRAINRANNIIRVVDDNLLSGTEFDNKKGQLKAEALFVRALCHFELCRFWAQPYDVDNQGGNSKPGVPYRTEPTLSYTQDLALARSSVEQVYTNVLNDLADAETLFETAGLRHSSHRASLMAATALKARVLFSKGDYAAASDAASVVINSNLYSLYPTNTDDEALLIPFQSEGYSISNETIFQLSYTTFDNGLNESYSQLSNLPVFQYAATDLITSYAPGDGRKSKWFLQNPVNLKGRITKYDRPLDVFYNVPVIRLAEMHLIRAEANMSPGGNGNTADALESYNAIRERAFGSNFIPETGTNQLLEKIQLERRWELCFENDRYHNLKRMKQPLRDGVAYNDPSPIFKIPQEEIAGNPSIEQNP
ncbi:MAG: RagB/SusD family nutrient uptake outer membrane protein [Flavobacteriales bacterium]|nr:RagB/SusD family nutrient uptake outer membrane protein [Flavobacteriales bacterium]